MNDTAMKKLKEHFAKIEIIETTHNGLKNCQVAYATPEDSYNEYTMNQLWQYFGDSNYCLGQAWKQVGDTNYRLSRAFLNNINDLNAFVNSFSNSTITNEQDLLEVISGINDKSAEILQDLENM